MFSSVLAFLSGFLPRKKADESFLVDRNNVINPSIVADQSEDSKTSNGVLTNDDDDIYDISDPYFEIQVVLAKYVGTPLTNGLQKELTKLIRNPFTLNIILPMIFSRKRTAERFLRTFFKNRKNFFDPLIAEAQEIETDFEPSKIIVYKIDYDCDEFDPYLEFQSSLVKALGRHLTGNERYLMSAVDDGGYGSDDSEQDVMMSTRKLKEATKRQEKKKEKKNTEGKKIRGGNSAGKKKGHVVKSESNRKSLRIEIMTSRKGQHKQMLTKVRMVMYKTGFFHINKAITDCVKMW